MIWYTNYIILIGGTLLKYTVEIDDNLIANFTLGAKNALNDQLDSYCNDIVNEAQRLEAIKTLDGVQPEVNGNTIRQVVGSYRITPENHKKKLWVVVAELLFEAVIFFLGIFFDKTKFAGMGTYTILYIVIFLITFTSLIISKLGGSEV